MKPVENIDDHLVAHDVTSLGAAGVFGLTATAITGSPEMGIATAALVTVTGVGCMRIGPFRRGVNRAALVVAEISPWKKVLRK